MLICLNAVAECGQSEREEMENCMMELSAGNTAAMEPLYRIANQYTPSRCPCLKAPTTRRK